MVCCRFRTNSSDTSQMAYLRTLAGFAGAMVSFSVFNLSTHSPLVLASTFFVLGSRPFSAGRAFAVFWLSSHGFNSSSKIFLRNSSTISAARFCISLVVWVGVLGERRPGMSQDSRQSLYIYTRCQRMGGKSVVQTMKPDIRQLRPF